ncbi:MAG TPA: YndJ family transporter [Candidatus Acidoferrum sp.]|nr:YndJ family transporter [Candidatus Acidoferrum sp.]
MKRSAIIGAVVWLGLLAAAMTRRLELEWIDLLFLFAPLVIVPLGLELTGRVEQGAGVSVPERLARVAQLPCALLVVVSFWFGRGILAASLASVWLAFCGLLALGGVIRLYNGGFRGFDAAFSAAAALYLPVGAAWLVASRFGLTPLGFQEPIVLLTAVHFHYAGFAAPLLARSSRRSLLERERQGPVAILLNVVAAGVLIGPGLLAAGFVIGPRVKLAAALVLAASETGLALSFLLALTRVASMRAKVLIAVAAGSVAFAMVLAALWAIGEYPLQPFVHLEQMARLHGTANAFGFTFCGLLGWIQATGFVRSRNERSQT